MTTQHSTDAKETPTSKGRETLPEPLRDVLDGPIDTKLQLIKHHADMALPKAFGTKKSLRKMSKTWPGSVTAGTAPLESPCRDGDTIQVRSGSTGRRSRSRSLGSGTKTKRGAYPRELPGDEGSGSEQGANRFDPAGPLPDSSRDRQQGDYGRVASRFVDGFGLSQSSVSRRFRERGQQALQEFEGRSLEKVVFGKEEEVLELFEDHTAHAERTHLTMRQMNGRLIRKGLGFSKELSTCRAAAEWEDAIYNLTRTHKSLRIDLTGPLNGKPGQRWKRRTPAMAAGLTDQVWSVRKLLQTVPTTNT